MVLMVKSVATDHCCIGGCPPCLAECVLHTGSWERTSCGWVGVAVLREPVLWGGGWVARVGPCMEVALVTKAVPHCYHLQQPYDRRGVNGVRIYECVYFVFVCGCLDACWCLLVLLSCLSVPCFRQFDCVPVCLILLPASFSWYLFHLWV